MSPKDVDSSKGQMEPLSEGELFLKRQKANCDVSEADQQDKPWSIVIAVTSFLAQASHTLLTIADYVYHCHCDDFPLMEVHVDLIWI